MSSKCGLKLIFTSIIFIVIVNGYAKDISGVERGHNRLNEYISHYETLNYDHGHLKASHNIAKRSVTKDHYVNLKFRAHGRDFHLRLKRDLNTFSDKLEIYDSNNSPIDDISTDHIYEGHVIGDPNSYVFGSILHDGVFEGKIITERDAYYVEHAKRYFNNTTNNNNKNNNNNNYNKFNNNNNNNNNNVDTKQHPQALRQSGSLTEDDLMEATKFANSSLERNNETVTTSKTSRKTATTTTISEATVTSPSNHSSSHTTPKGATATTSSKNGENTENTGKAGIGFHSVIYKDSHVDDAYKSLREGHVAGCGITDEVSQWMENIQNSAVEELPVPMSKDDDTAHQKLHKKRTAAMAGTAGNEDVDILTVVGSGSIADLAAPAEDNAPAALTKNNNNKTNGNANANANTNININSNNNKNHHKKYATPTTIWQGNSTFTGLHHPPKKYNSHNVGGGSGSNNNHHHTSNNNNNNSNNKANSNSNNNNHHHNNNGANDDFKFPHQKYTKDANFRATFYDPETGRKFEPTMNDDWHERVHERVRRASGSPNASGRREDNKNTCSLYIQTDPLIWRHIREGIADHDRGGKFAIDIKTREEITSLIAHHVTAVNYIYRNTKFDGLTEHRNIRFEVQRIKIDDDTACRTSYNGPHNAFCNEHMDVSNFLNLHSLEDHSLFCLAYVFTYRDFTGGTLGLAWVASASGASGGICEKFKTYTETVGGQYQSTKRSLNTGIITFVNYNSRVPPKVSQLTLAHEIGHNFGSPHDYPQECRPGGLNGNYIMFASATSGDRPNNSKFSPCSIRNISHVLDVLVGNPKRDCFKASEGAFCGNKIVEIGEECDCGFNEEECKDKCCYPRIISEYDFTLNSSAKGCARRAKTQCSPSQGPCCLADACTFVPMNYHQKCKEETECSWSSTCNGTTAECPDPKPRDDKTKCNNGTALCIRGECSGSICLLWNMSECFLTSQATPHVDKRKLCELACQNGNDTGTCRSTSEFAHLYGLPPGGINLRPGSPCDNFQGYCDVFLKCRAVDADGPLVRLKNLLLNRETLRTVAQWVTENWYIVVLIGIAFILVMGVFIKCCAVHTPSSNPKKRRARRISETLRAPMNTLRRMRHPHGRGAGPRSIPPPVHDSRSHQRNHPPEWDRRDPRAAAAGHVSRSGASGRPPGRSSRAPAAAASGRPASSSRAAASAAAGQGQHGYAAGAGRNSNLPVSSARTQMPLPLPPTGAAGSAQVPTQSQQQQQQPQLPPQQQQAYFAPKAVAPPPVSYNNRPPSLHNPDLYADAYAALGRGAYEVTGRAPNSKV